MAFIARLRAITSIEGQLLQNTFWYRTAAAGPIEAADLSLLADSFVETVYERKLPEDPCLTGNLASDVDLIGVGAMLYDGDGVPMFDRESIYPYSVGGEVNGKSAGAQFYLSVAFSLAPAPLAQYAPKRSYIALGPLPASWFDVDFGSLSATYAETYLSNLVALDEPIEAGVNTFEPVRVSQTVNGFIKGYGLVNGAVLRTRLIKERKSRRPE